MHNLNYNASKREYSFAYTGTLPWHGLGQHAEEAMTTRQAIELSNCGFLVKEEPIYRMISSMNPDNDEVQRTGSFPELIETHKCTIREDTGDVLGVVGKDYQIVQNVECFEFFDHVIEEGKGIFETVGVLGKGEVLFITAKINDSFIVADNDLIDKYVVFINSHDMSYALTAFFTPIRVVCNNTLNAALDNCRNQVKMKHTSGIKDQMEEAHKLLGLYGRYTDAIKNIFDAMYAKSVRDSQMDMILRQIILSKEMLTKLETEDQLEIHKRSENIMSDIKKFYYEDATVAAIRGTGYGVYNAVTGYMDHIRQFSDASHRMSTILLKGAAKDYQQRAVKVIMSL
jgi:phage/plasmid-like protein (TIGR03299 family)